MTVRLADGRSLQGDKINIVPMVVICTTNGGQVHMSSFLSLSKAKERFDVERECGDNAYVLLTQGRDIISSWDFG